MFFLFRSLICIGAVYALALSDRPSPPESPAGVAVPRSVVQPQAPARQSHLAETAKTLVQQSVDALGAAARDHCSAEPRECLATLRRLNGVRAP